MTRLSRIVQTPHPPYYAVIFSTQQTDSDEGYDEMTQTMMEHVEGQPGFLGVEAAQAQMGIMVSYWDSLEAIANWKQNGLHQAAQERGKSEWYQSCQTRICKVEHDYGFRR